MDCNLYAVRVFTTRWEEAATFYRDVLGLPEKFSDAQMGWAEFDVGGPCLAVERIPKDDPEAAELVGRFLGVSLEVEHIKQTYDALCARNVEFTSPPTRQPWGGVLAHFKDLDGNVLTLLGTES